jgi:hypothetical protein
MPLKSSGETNGDTDEIDDDPAAGGRGCDSAGFRLRRRQQHPGQRRARLVPPVGDEGRIKSYLTAYESAVVEMEQVASDPARTRALISWWHGDATDKPRSNDPAFA